MWKKIEKNIIQRGKYSFLVRLMINGKTIDETFDTEDEARIFRDKHLHSAALDVHQSAVIESRIKKQQSKTYLLKDAIKDYRKRSEIKKGATQEKASLDLLTRLPISEKSLYMIGKTDLIQMFAHIKSGSYRKVRKTKVAKTDKDIVIRPASDATARRYSNLARHIFECAKNDGKIERNPFDLLSKDERPQDGRARDRRFRGNEYEHLQKVLDVESRVALTLFVESAMRRGELLAIDWKFIKFIGNLGTVHIPDSKTDESRTVPLSSVASNALKSLLKDGVLPTSGKVFTLTPASLNHKWRSARVVIGSPDLRVHDLRHEATSRLFEDKNLNVVEAATITGHKSLSMLKRYANLNPELLAKKLG